MQTGPVLSVISCRKPGRLKRNVTGVIGEITIREELQIKFFYEIGRASYAGRSYIIDHFPLHGAYFSEMRRCKTCNFLKLVGKMRHAAILHIKGYLG